MYIKKLLGDDVHYTYMDNGFDYYGAVPKDMTLGIAVDGVRIPKPMPQHSHPEIEQVYYIRSGRGRLTINNETAEVEKDNIIYIPPGASHGMEPLPSDEELTYIFFSHWHEMSSKDK